jgi:hypothetical protein
MKKTIFLFIYFFITTIFGCRYSYEKKIVNDYYLFATDGVMELTSLGRKNEVGFSYIIKYGVYAAGYNDNFIIIKQHPANLYNVNKAWTNYYIVPYNEDKTKTMNDTLSSLTKEEFYEKRNELGIDKNLDFTIVIKELE